MSTKVSPTDDTNQAEIISAYLSTRRQFEDLTPLGEPELRTRLAAAERAAEAAAAANGQIDSILAGIIVGDPQLIRRELERRAAVADGRPPPAIDQADEVADTLQAAGLSELTKESSLTAVEEALRNFALLIAGADEIRRATVREAAIKKLGDIGISAPAKLIDAAIPKGSSSETEGAGKTLFLADPEPWENPVDCAELLDEITALIHRYIVLSPDSARAVALWILHAWALDAFDISPLLGITSPTKRCGKTTLLEIVSHLSPRTVAASNITSSALFRVIEKYAPTLLVDEADSFLGDNEELRGVINSGHRRASAFVVRNVTVADDFEPRLFSTWGAKAVALIGKLPATLEDRSILIVMRRRAPGEIVERFRSSALSATADPLRRKAFRWAADHQLALRAADPELPAELHDRAADNWRPLVSIADLAGGEWPERAKAAALALSKESDESENSALIDLLTEIQEIFKSRDRITSADLAEALGAKPESRFAEWRAGKPITQRQVARLLAPLKIKPYTIREGSETAKGYPRSSFDDAFTRYLPHSIRHSVISEQDHSVMPENDPSQKDQCDGSKVDLSMRDLRESYHVTDEKAEKAPPEGIGGAIDPWDEV